MNIYTQTIINVIGADAFAAARAHAREQFPKESCGYVSDGKYVACLNKADDPEKHFKIVDQRFTKAMKAGKVEAIIHSHPNGPIFPSEDDMVGQIATDVPWVIITLNEDNFGETVAWGDDLPIAPLIQRPFCHGIFDCYSLIRDAYRLGKAELAKQGVAWPFERQIVLPEFARDDSWWQNEDRDLYMTGFSKAGFAKITRDEARPGDIFLMGLGDSRSNPLKRINHGGLLLAGNLVLHHKPGRLSHREPAGLWVRAADLWVRYQGETA